MWIGGEGCFISREQPVPRPWGRSIPGVYEEQQDNWYIWTEERQREISHFIATLVNSSIYMYKCMYIYVYSLYVPYQYGLIFFVSIRILLSKK